jgi:hypothetical protein
MAKTKISVSTDGFSFSDLTKGLKQFSPETPNQSYVDSVFPSSVLLNSNKMHFPKDLEEMDGFTMDRDYALQFDAIKFAEWLKDKFAKPLGIKHIEKNIDRIVSGEDGIEKLILEVYALCKLKARIV